MGALSIAFALSAGACSADKDDHPDRRKTCDEGLTLVGGYCVRKPAEDSGRPELDAGTDSGVDAEVPETCGEVGEQMLCYPYADQATAQQRPCSPGLRTCGGDHLWGECEGAVGPSDERCDGEDNDCDGNTDEEQLQKTCKVRGNVRGACAEGGFAVCRGGREECIQMVTPKSETCNGVDDDCDGKTDEGISVVCYGGGDECRRNELGGYDCVPASTCTPGRLRCVAGTMQTDCVDEVLPRNEVATSVNQVPLDEDCDGAIDEGFSCLNGEDYPCYTGPPSTRTVRPCREGQQRCTDGAFGACMNETTPAAETCANEGEDNDCDGLEDNVPRRGTSCSDASDTQGSCKTLATWQCVDGAERCVSGAMAAEICDGRNEDEDCDGAVDEGFDTQVDENNCGSCGMRCGAGLTCCGGHCVNTTASNGHCGACGTPCGSGLTCCNSGCVNTRSNASHCGTCTRSCLLGCSNGKCNLL